MVSAAIAAFFYLRLAVTMYSPVGLAGDMPRAPSRRSWPEPEPEPDRDRGRDPCRCIGPGAMSAGEPVVGPPAGDGALSLRALTDDPPLPAVSERGVVPVPPLTALCIGICVAFSVVFGIIPAPIVDFAHQATLLFL